MQHFEIRYFDNNFTIGKGRFKFFEYNLLGPSWSAAGSSGYNDMMNSSTFGCDLPSNQL